MECLEADQKAMAAQKMARQEAIRVLTEANELHADEGGDVCDIGDFGDVDDSGDEKR